jgi:hypothetical protein
MGFFLFPGFIEVEALGAQTHYWTATSVGLRAGFGVRREEAWVGLSVERFALLPPLLSDSTLESADELGVSVAARSTAWMVKGNIYRQILGPAQPVFLTGSVGAGRARVDQISGSPTLVGQKGIIGASIGCRSMPLMALPVSIQIQVGVSTFPSDGLDRLWSTADKTVTLGVGFLRPLERR